MSENQPSQYSASRCEYFIHVEQTKTISIAFVSLSLGSDCDNDYMILYDYFEGKYEQAKKLCGNELPAYFVSKSNRMKIYFESNGDESSEGFKLMYSESDIPKTIPPSGMLKCNILCNIDKLT